jgi:hypothetical protein
MQLEGVTKMSFHIKMTMAILFMNIFITLMFPSLVLGNNNLYQKTVNDNYNIDSDLQNSVSDMANREGGLPILGDFFDVLFLAYDFFKALVSILFSSFVILFMLPGTWALLIGVPVGVVYIMAIVGWVYR